MPEQDRYKPPLSEVDDAPRGRGSAVKGVLLRFLVDTGGTIAFTFIIAFFYAIVLAVLGRSEAEVRSALQHPEGDAVLSALGVVGGCAFSVLGGYIWERIARWRNYRLAAVLIGIDFAIGLLLGASSDSVPMQVLLYGLTIGSIVLGTRLAIDKGR